MLFVIGFILGMAIVATLLSAISSYIIGKSLGFSVRYFRFLFWDISKINGDFKFTTRTFTPICQLSIGKIGITEQEDKLNTILTNLINFVVAAAMLLTLLLTHPGEFDPNNEETLLSFALGIVIGNAFHVIFMIIAAINFYATKDKNLFYFVKKIGQDYVSGYPIEHMNLPPLENLELTGEIASKHIYQNYRYMQKLCLNAYNELPPIISWMENNLAEGFLKYETPTYYNLIFYYSYINFNHEKAAFYYSKACDELINDTDSNGRRILAYYLFYVLRNPNAARETAVAGLSTISTFSICDAEREFEAKLLNALIQKIDVFNMQHNFAGNH